jgi:branched-subunit amino acid transport protein
VRLRLRPDLPTRADLRTFATYGLAAAVYIAIGVAYQDFLLSVVVGMGYLVLAMWLLPAIVRRLRR